MCQAVCKHVSCVHSFTTSNGTWHLQVTGNHWAYKTRSGQPRTKGSIDKKQAWSRDRPKHHDFRVWLPWMWSLKLPLSSPNLGNLLRPEWPGCKGGCLQTLRICSETTWFLISKASLYGWISLAELPCSLYTFPQGWCPSNQLSLNLGSLKSLQAEHIDRCAYSLPVPNGESAFGDSQSADPPWSHCEPDTPCGQSLLVFKVSYTLNYPFLTQFFFQLHH